MPNESELNEVQTENSSINISQNKYPQNFVAKEKNFVQTFNAKQSEKNTTPRVVKKSEKVITNISSQVASIVVAVTGAVVGVTATNILPLSQNNVTAKIINLESDVFNMSYSAEININQEEDFLFEDAGIIVNLSNDFVNLDCNIFSPESEQDHSSSISPNFEVYEDLEEDQETKQGLKFVVNGHFDGLKENMPYNLTIKIGTKVLDKKSFRTKNRIVSEEQPTAPPEETNISATAEITEFEESTSVTYFNIELNINSLDFNFEDLGLKLNLSDGNNNYTKTIILDRDSQNNNEQSIVMNYNVYEEESQDEQTETIYTIVGTISGLIEETNYTFSLIMGQNILVSRDFNIPKSENITAQISVTPYDLTAYYQIDLAIETSEEIFDFNSAQIVLYISNLTGILCQQDIVKIQDQQDDGDGSSVGEGIVISFNVEETESNEDQQDGVIYYSISGYIQGLTESTNYTLIVESKSQTLNQEDFSTTE